MVLLTTGHHWFLFPESWPTTDQDLKPLQPLQPGGYTGDDGLMVTTSAAL